jgi:hypothetical protein
VVPVADLEQAAEPVIVRLPAEIGMDNAEDVGEQLSSAFTPGVTVVIADLASTVFCDSAGARQFVLAHQLADARDALWGSRTRPLWLTWAFCAARSYSLRRPPRTGRRLARTWGEVSDRVIGYGRVELAAAMRSSAVVVGLVLG